MFSVLGIRSPEQLGTHYLRGNIFECFVVAEHVKMRTHAGRSSSAFFWRDSVGHEIAPLVEVGSEVRAIEIKSSETLTDELFSGLFWSGEESVALGLADGLGSSGYVARELIGAEEIVEFTAKKDLLERFADRLGASIADSLLNLTGVGAYPVAR